MSIEGVIYLFIIISIIVIIFIIAYVDNKKEKKIFYNKDKGRGNLKIIYNSNCNINVYYEDLLRKNWLIIPNIFNKKSNLKEQNKIESYIAKNILECKIIGTSLNSKNKVIIKKIKNITLPEKGKEKTYVIDLSDNE